MAKKRKARKTKAKRKRTTKKNDRKKRSTRKSNLRVVAKRENNAAEIPQAPTPSDIFEGIKGRRPNSDEELNKWLASPEGEAAMRSEQSIDRRGETI